MSNNPSPSIEERLSNIEKLLIKLNTGSTPPGRASNELPPFFGIDICAEVTGFAKPTIYRNTSKNLMPHFKREGKIYFKREEVYAWMTENRIKTVSEIIQEADEKFVKARKGRAS
jgi:predicted DNA-binding transcriptional regulator AlpA